jgi:hypothetical protein
MADTVRIELEFGSVEFEFEGPADFARKDLLPLIDGLVERLSGLGDSYEIEVDEFDDEDEDDEEADAAPKPGGAH